MFKVYFFVFLLILLGLFSLKIKSWLKKMNQPKAEKFFDDLAPATLEKLTDLYVDNPRLKQIIKKFPNLFANKNYFANFDGILSLISTFVDQKSETFFGKGRVVLTDDAEHPLQLTEAMMELTHNITAGATSESGKAQSLFDWFEKNISYGKDKRGPVGYRTSEEVFSSFEGVCGEMAILFMVMARVSGLDAHFVSVDVDYSGAAVNHACALVVCEGRKILVDPAYHSFDIKHQKFSVLSDTELLATFKSYRSQVH